MLHHERLLFELRELAGGFSHFTVAPCKLRLVFLKTLFHAVVLCTAGAELVLKHVNLTLLLFTDAFLFLNLMLQFSHALVELFVRCSLLFKCGLCVCEVRLKSVGFTSRLRERL